MDWRRKSLITPLAGIVMWSGPVWAQGPVVLGGDDMTDHGSVSGGVPQDGWKYIQLALQSIAPNVSRPGNDGSIAALGASPSTATASNGGAAIGAAGAAASMAVNYFDGETAINNFFAALANGSRNPAIIWLAGTEATNNIDAAEGAALTAHAGDIAAFVNSGGGLMAHGAGDDAYGWLFALFPGLDDVTGGSFGDLVLTGAGTAFLSGTLTNAEINTGPWHNHFEGNLGSLDVLVKSSTVMNSQGDSAAVIIGGASVVLPPVQPTPVWAPYELTPFFGVFFFDDSLPIEDGALIGLRLSYNFADMWSVEGEFAVTQTDDQSGDLGIVPQLSGNVLFYVVPPTQQIRPFITIGVGVLSFNGFTSNDESFAVNAGLGVKGRLDNRLGVRLDLRDYIATSAFGAGTTHNLQITTGIIIFFP